MSASDTYVLEFQDALLRETDAMRDVDFFPLVMQALGSIVPRWLDALGVVVASDKANITALVYDAARDAFDEALRPEDLGLAFEQVAEVAECVGQERGVEPDCTGHVFYDALVDWTFALLDGYESPEQQREQERLAQLAFADAHPEHPRSLIIRWAYGDSADPHDGTNEKSSSPNDGGTLGIVPAYPMDALTGAARRLVDDAATAGLPAALVGGAALGALATALGSAAQLEVHPGWQERPILWVPLLAPRGGGKSPAQQLAFAPLREHDADLADDDDGQPVLLGDMTLEALARELHAMDGAGALDLDELSVLLRGLGEYKRAGGGDRGRFLGLWTGAPWSFTRVGQGKKANAVRLRLPRPTLVICGGLQPLLHELLGGDDDGLRPRWLPHLAAMPDHEGDLLHVEACEWTALLDTLLAARDQERTWHLSERAKVAFERYRSGWKRKSRNGEPASVTGALVKADIHLARVALVLAEAEHPASGGVIGPALVERAARIVEFTIQCWRALPEQGGLALSPRDRILDEGITRLIAWLEEHGGRATRRQLQQSHVAGARTARDLDALLERYEASFPGTVTTEHSSHGGPATVIVSAPRRRAFPTVATGNTEGSTAEIPHEHGRSDGVAPGNSATGNAAVGNGRTGGQP